MKPAEYRDLTYQLVRRHQGVRVKGRPLIIEVSKRGNVINAGIFDPNTVSIEVFGHQLSERQIFYTLCHELGHWESWSRGEDSSDHLAEEQRAWFYGRQFAIDVGADDAEYTEIADFVMWLEKARLNEPSPDHSPPS